MNLRNLLSACLLVATFAAYAQESIEWSPGAHLEYADFQSPATDFNSSMLSIHPGCRIDFSYQMSNYEFMFRKNFNDLVVCRFVKMTAAIVAPDTATADNLLRLAQYDFDLGELYARRLRKRIFEEKGAFSSADFFQPIVSEIDQQRNMEFNKAAKESKFGADTEKLAELHAAVKQEIELLADFCKKCKPKKVRKS